MGYQTALFERPDEDEDNVYIAVGFGCAGNPLEIGYREFDDGRFYIFHAMACQDKWLKEASIEG